MITASDLWMWAGRELSPDSPSTSRLSRGGGFWFVLEGEAAEEYNCACALVQTSHCTDCGVFLLWVTPEGKLFRCLSSRQGNSFGEVEVESLDDLKFGDWCDDRGGV